MAEKRRSWIGNSFRFGLPAIVALGAGACGLNAANSEEAAEAYIDSDEQTIEVPVARDGFDALPLGEVAAAVQGAIDSSSAQELLIEHIEDEEVNPGCEVIIVDNADLEADTTTSSDSRQSVDRVEDMSQDDTEVNPEDSGTNTNADKPNQRLIVGCDEPTIEVPSVISLR